MVGFSKEPFRFIGSVVVRESSKIFFAGLLVASLFVLNQYAPYLLTQAAENDPGNVKVTVTRQVDAAAITGATVSVQCDGETAMEVTEDGAGDQNGVAGDGIIELTPNAGTGCETDTESMTVIAWKSGTAGNDYAKTSFSSTWLSGSVQAVTANNVKFPLKVVVKNQAGVNVAGGGLVTKTFAGRVADVEEDNILYWADNNAGAAGTLDITTRDAGNTNEYLDAISTNPGFDSETQGVTTSIDAQVVITMATGAGADGAQPCTTALSADATCRGLEFPLGIVVNDQLGNNITSLDTATWAGAGLTQIAGTNLWGAAIVEPTNQPLALNKVGYLNNAESNSAFGAIQTSSWTTQLVITVDGSAPCTTTPITASASCRGLEFGQVIVMTREADGGALTGATVTAGSANTACTISDNEAYCPVPVGEDGGANDITITKDGYVTNTSFSTSDRVDGTSATGDITANNIKFAYKLTSITTEALAANITASATAVAVGDDSGTNACVLSGGSWYCPTVLANSDGTLVANVTLDGYVQDNYNLVTGTTRLANTDAQLSDTVTGVKYAIKITATREGDNTAFAGATVTVGDAYDTSCTENGTTGVYYCVEPLAKTGASSQIVKTGYETTATAYTDRTADTDAQQALTPSIKFQLKVVTTLSDGSAINISDIDTITFNGVEGTPTYSSTNVAYWAVAVSNASLVVNEATYTNAATTNTGFTDVSTGPTAGQTVITMGNNDVRSSAVANGDDITAKGLVIDNSGKITVTAGPEAGANTLLDGATVTLSCTGGSAQNLTGDGTLTSGSVGPAAPKAASDCADGETGTVSVAKAGYVTKTAEFTYSASQNPNTVPVGNTVKFALRVDVFTERGNTDEPFLPLDSITYDTAEVTATSGSNVFFWAVGASSSKTLHIRRSGYVDAEVTNTGFTDVSVDAAQGQTTISMGGNALSSAIAAGSTVSPKGMQYSHWITWVREGHVDGNSDNFTFNGGQWIGNALTFAGVSCSVWGGGHESWCVIPAGTDGGADDIVWDGDNLGGFESGTATSTARANEAAPQRTYTITITPQLKVVFADSDGTSVDATAVTETLNGSGPSYSNGSASYWGGCSGCGLSVVKAGYYNAEVTNTGLTAITTSKNGGQTVITMGNFTPNADAIGDGGVNVQGFVLNTQGRITITAGPEVGANTLLDGATVTVSCPDGSAQNLTGDGTLSSGSVGPAQPKAAADCTDGETATVTITKTGFETKTATFTYSATADPNTFEVGNTVLFQLKVIVKDELGNAIAPVGTIQFNGENFTASSFNIFYWAFAATSQTLTVQENGFVNSDTTNTGLSLNVSTSAANGQTIITFGTDAVRSTAVADGDDIAVKGLQFGQKVTVTREGDSATVTPTSVTAGSANTACTIDTSIAYCPVIVAEDNAQTITIATTGYETDTSFTTTNRTDGSSAQAAIAANTIKPVLKVVVTNELGTAVNISDLDTITFSGEAATYSSTNTAYWTTVASNVGLVLVEDGYVNSVATNTGLSDITTSASNGQTVVTFGTGVVRSTAVSDGSSVNGKGLVFGYKLTAITTQTVAADITATATVVAVGDDTATDACTLSSGAWYCPTVLANSDGTLIAVVTKDGYVQQSYNLTTGTNRSVGTDAQVSDTVAGVFYAYAVTAITTEALAADIVSSATAVAVGDDTATTACTRSGSVWYCPTVLANSDGTTVANVTLDGYVRNNYALVGAATRSADTDNQRSETVTGVQYAIKVTATREGDSAALAGSTVTVGNSYDTSCTEDGSTGVYYCVEPLAKTGASAKVIKSGYETTTASYTDRTVNTDAQQAVSITNKFQLKVVTTNVAGEAINISDIDTITFNGETPTYSSTNIAFWAVTEANKALAINETGYVNAATTNTGFSDVSTSADNDQTVITMNTGSSRNTPVADGDTITAKGFVPAAGAGTILITAGPEAGNAELLDGASVTVLCTGGVATALTGDITLSGGSVGPEVSQSASSCDQDDAVTVTITKDGFVTTAVNTINYQVLSNPNTFALGNVVPFAQKVTISREGDNSAVTPDSVTAGSGNTTCTLSSNVAYCPVLVAQDGTANDITITAAGYETKTTSTTNRANGSSAQGSISASLLFQLKVVTADSTGSAINISDLNAITFNDANPTYSAGATAYWATTAANVRLHVVKNGSLNGDFTNTGLADVTTTATGGQTVITFDNASARSSAVDNGASVTVRGLVASAGSGDVIVTAGPEAGSAGALGSAVVIITCTGGSETLLGNLSNGSLGSLAVPGGADCDDGETATVTITQTGFVTKSLQFTFDADANPNEFVFGNTMLYGQKVTITREGDSAAVTPTLVTAGSGNTTCTLVSNVAYCPVPVAQDGGSGDITITATGYETDNQYSTVNRTSGTSGQSTIDATIKFVLKVIVYSELSGVMNISDLDTITFNGGAPTLPLGNIAYWTTRVANKALVIREDGYVNAETSNTGFADVTTTATNGQTVIQVYGGSALTDAVDDGDSATAIGLLFGQKISVTREVDDQAIGPTSVTAGSANTTCTISSNIAYCPVPVAQDGGTNDATVVISGYKTTTTSTTNRTGGTSEQANINLAGVKFQLKVVVADSAGTAINVSDLTVATYNGGGVTYSTGSTAYWAVEAANASLSLAKTNYDNVNVTNTGLTDVSTGPTAGQTVITLGANSVRTTATSNGQSVTARGLTNTITEGDVQVTAAPEVGETTLLNGATITLVCDGGSATALTGSPTLSGGSVGPASPQVGSGCQNEEEATIALSKDGYVTKTVTFTYDVAGRPNLVEMGSTVLFAQKVTLAREGDDQAIGPTSVTAGASNTVCTISSNIAYCPVPVAQDGTANDITVVASGYVTKQFSTTNRTAGTSAQAEVAASNIKSQLKLIVKDEQGQAINISDLNGISFGGYGGGYFYSVDNTAYAPIELSNSTLSIVKAGYTNAETTNEGLADVSVSAAAQTVLTLGANAVRSSAVAAGASVSAKGLVVDAAVGDITISAAPEAGDAALLDGAVVTVQCTGGSANRLTGNETMSSGVIPAAFPKTESSCDNNDTATVVITKSGFVTDTYDFTYNATARPNEFAFNYSPVRFPVALTVYHELSGTLDPTTLDTLTFDGATPTATSSTSAFWATTDSGSFAIREDGYVNGDVTNPGLTQSFTPSVAAQTAIQLYPGYDSLLSAPEVGTTTNVAALLFGHKVIVTREGDAGAVNNVESMTAGANQTTCVTYAIDQYGTTSHIWYCAVPVADDNGSNDITITKTGYETSTHSTSSVGNRTSGSSGQLVVTANNLKPQLKVVVATETGTSVNIADVTTVTFDEQNPTYSVDNVAYWAVAPASFSPMVIIKTGSVNAGATNTALNAVSTGSGNGQTVITMGEFVARSGSIADGENVNVRGLAGASAGDITVTAGAEAGGGTPLGNAPVTIACSGGTETFLGYLNRGALGPLQPPSGAGCNDGDTITISITQTGFVTSSLSDNYSSALQPNIYGFGNTIQYGQKVYVTREVDGAAITPAQVTAGSNNTVCTISTNIAYCPVPVAEDGGNNDIRIVTTGYKTNTSYSTVGRADGRSPQQVISAPNILFQLHIEVADELGNAVSADTLTTATFNGVNATLKSGANAYWAVQATNAPLIIGKNGFVTSSTTNAGLAQVTTAATGAQTTITFDTGAARETAVGNGASVTAKGLLYAHKITFIREGDDGAVNPASVTAGSANTACVFNGNGSSAYCAVPITQDGGAYLENGSADIRSVATGYVTHRTASTYDRTDNATGQMELTATMRFQLKVFVADEAGRNYNINELATITYNGISPTYAVDNLAYWDVEADSAALDIVEDGFVDIDTINRGFSDITTTTTTQTVIIMGPYQPWLVPIDFE